MIKMGEFWDRDESIAPHYARWLSGRYDEWLEGVIYTTYGIVFVSIGYGSYEHTRLEFVRNGRCYNRGWNRAWGKRTAVRLAKQFAKEVCGE